MEGVPHHMAGRMEARRRAKSQGCQFRGTLRTTATRGWRNVGVRGLPAAAAAAAASSPESVSLPAAAVGTVNALGLLVVAVKRGADGGEGTEEARWWWWWWWERGAMAGGVLCPDAEVGAAQRSSARPGARMFKIGRSVGRDRVEFEVRGHRCPTRGICIRMRKYSMDVLMLQTAWGTRRPESFPSPL